LIPPHSSPLPPPLPVFIPPPPTGLQVFFPSYAALKGAHERWSRPTPDGKQTILQRLEKLKHVVLEPRSAAEVAIAVDAFRHHVSISERTGIGGAMLFAVCRGRLSEGVDFSDAACRAVVVTGLPLPPAYDAKVQLKREFLDGCIKAAGPAGRASRLSGEEWCVDCPFTPLHQRLVSPLPLPLSLSSPLRYDH
jgi:regulator of telomere elongation helicase 1